MNFSSLKALICDDSVLARKNMLNILMALGFTDITEAANGQAAVDKCSELNPDVVFLDIIMPVKDGISATREIKAMNPDIKIIICSSVGTQSHLREAVSAGANDFIQKPVESGMVKKIVEHLFA